MGWVPMIGGWDWGGGWNRVVVVLSWGGAGKRGGLIGIAVVMRGGWCVVAATIDHRGDGGRGVGRKMAELLVL